MIKAIRRLPLFTASLIAMAMHAMTLSSAWAGSQPTVHFHPAPVDAGKAGWMQEIAAKYGLFLHPAGVYALDGDTAFVFGSMNTVAGAFKSVLLRTDDGGRHWIEIIPPLAASRVAYAAMTADGNGWVLVQSDAGKSGKFSLYHSTNHGRLWQAMPGVAMAEANGQLLGMEFSDARNGRIRMRYPTDNPGQFRNAFLTTVDGGKSWQETASVFAEDEPAGNAASETADKANEWQASDGSRWKIKTDDQEKTVVSRLLPGKKGWETVSIFAGRFPYTPAK